MIRNVLRKLFASSMLGFFCCTVSAEPEVLPQPRPVEKKKATPAAKLEELPTPRGFETLTADYRSVEKAISANEHTSGGRTELTGFLGISLQKGERGQPVVEEIQPDSPAAKAGIKKGDVVASVGDHAVRTPLAFREWLQSHNPDEMVKIGLIRGGKPLDVEARLIATSRPMKLGTGRVYLGITLGDTSSSGGIFIESVTADSPAAAAGLRNGDRMLKAEGKDLENSDVFMSVLEKKSVGDTITLSVKRDGKDMDIKATLSNPTTRPRFGGAEGRTLPLWKKNVMKIAVICIEFPDIKHNAKNSPEEVEKIIFRKDLGKEKPATNQQHGSLNDWLIEQSSGAFHIEGKAMKWVEVKKKRGDYIEGLGTSNKTAVLVEALNVLVARDGKTALDGFDALFFLYAGERARGNRGTVYFPHAGIVNFQSGRHTYFVGSENGSALGPIGSYAKEMVMALGMPDLAARQENIGSEGLGRWCALSDVFSTGTPQHLCAWSKERLGWIKPVVIDPTVKQKLVLAPIENSPNQCFKVLVRPDGSEYLLLENRAKKGFDLNLPGEGLIIWRVVNNKPILEESHGIEGPAGPTTQLAAVPYPSPANNAFTPDTIPSSRSPVGGGLPVHITEIRRHADGRISFQIGYEYR